ncbi:glycerate dehydrogenase [Candidatus Roizmanbacteria bacterium CG_4_9_14_3_um_filter_33_18]|uniref:Glycerate dehydrogenase n=2 Tax=Candidatus Roizmaniibacteriota TaxID=1752723 RepID=A0A2M7XX73_9BACT|nr:MAG: glycerate dehydrogenase [Candidatus Roizmanbacteria bacterium CG22_combo_CG10-13_8_21_14_all_34_12]PJA55230.1 MAG: glycerate dehydrogenase [Candidatus Roizmanbacteria bacterium CG_4_9_14_3_um_filter_33_18]
MKIISVDKVVIYPEHLQKLKKFGEVIIYNNVPNEKEGIKRIKDADIIVDNWYKMPANVIASAPSLKMICVAATGYEWIDLNETRKRNILVSNSPCYSSEAVAEHTIGLLLHSIRRASESEREMANGKWDPMKFKGKELKRKTLGIIGFGSIGKRIAEITEKGFNMKILHINTQSSITDFERLLKESDFISINAPLTEKTKGMIGQKEFDLMKVGVAIVNTGRGAIINEESLISNLKSGKVFSAGLDVFSNQPINKDNPLFKLTNVTLTPHIGFNTEESEYRLSEIVVNNIKNFIEGHPINIV